MPQSITRVRPTPTDAYLPNPHRGCCTFQRFNGDPLYRRTNWSEEGPRKFPAAREPVADGYLPTTVAYCRWYWYAMEPEQGEYDFSMIDGALETCRARGQTLAVRLMSYGHTTKARVPEWYRKRYPMTRYAPHGRTYQVPVHDAPAYLEHWGGFIREFGRRYDSHPLLESIDITYIGPWGEGAGECSPRRIAEFTQLWKTAFPNTPRIALVSGEKMRAAIASGAGWRCDCFGDLMFGDEINTGANAEPRNVAWNHMYDCYPREIVTCGAQDAWRTAPIHLETCWVPMTWYKQGVDLDFILQQGLKYHATYFMPKSTTLPEPWMDKLGRFCNQLGYRYVYRQAIFDRQVNSGESFRFQSWIENVGVAPIYRKYDLALRLRQDGREHIVAFDDVDIRSWLPGDAWIDRRVRIPDGFRPGWVQLAAALIDPATRTPRVSFAVKESFVDRWVDLHGIEVLAPGRSPA